MILFILIPLPYLAVFFIVFLSLSVFGMRIRPAVTASVLFSLALNLTLTFCLKLSADDYALAALGFALRILPFVIIVGMFTFILNAKAIFSDIDQMHPRRVVMTAMISAALVASVLTIYNRYPHMIIPESAEVYVDRDKLRTQLCSKTFGSITLYIEVLNADSSGYTAEAVYFPFGGSLGVQEYQYSDGSVDGCYYDPGR